MGKTFVCDGCDRRINSGYTVAWSHTLEESPMGVGYETHIVKNLCSDCFPDKEKSPGDIVQDMF